MRNPSRKPLRSARGAALIEVLVAITLLATAGLGLVSLLTQTTYSVRQVHRRERDTRTAAAQLDRVSLWTRAQLDSRTGTSRVLCCTLIVQPLSAVLYRVALADTLTDAVLLETTLYHPLGVPTNAP